MRPAQEEREDVVRAACESLVVVEDELDAGAGQELPPRPFLDLLRRHALGTSAEHSGSTGSGARRRPGGPQVGT